MNKMKEISFYDFERLIIDIEKRSFNFPRDSLYYEKLENLVYGKKYEKGVDRYDKREDKFFGLSGDVINLPDAPSLPKPKVETIIVSTTSVKKVDIDLEIVGAESIGAICQHNVTWEKISAIRKKNPNDFTKLLYEFILRYVIENYEGDYVCRSCGTMINIKNYVPGGTYNSDGQFVSLYSHMDVPLEDVPEYEKYILTIRNLEKQIDRLASIGNVQFLVNKSSNATKVAIKRIIKDTIDLLIIHNRNLEKIYKGRNEIITQRYGIDKESSNLFVFELENSIFIYSSKDKDYYKPIKRNNILTYILFFTLLEYTDSQTLFASGDRTCNYYLFSKFGFQMFANLKIIKNDANEVTSIQNYKVLCYLIFYFSCLITKYNMWYHEISTQTSDKTTSPSTKTTTTSKRFNPVTQKSIIHTLVDLLNSVLEISSTKKKKTQHLYEIASVKFFQKLNTVYQNEELLSTIKELEANKIVKEGTKIRFRTTTIKSIILPKEFTVGNYQGVAPWLTEYTCRVAKLFFKNMVRVLPEYYQVNNVTNCEDGRFHKWKNNGKTMKCGLCDKLLSDIRLDTALTASIMTNYRYNMLRRTVGQYCTSSTFQKYLLSTKTKCNACAKCRIKGGQDLSNSELDELDKHIIAMKEYMNDAENKKVERRKARQLKKDKYITSVVNDLKSEYSKTKSHKEDYFGFINEFINNIDSNIGKDININSQNIYTQYDTYIIDHDHNGFPIKEPIIISEKDNKIKYKKDHEYFKKDVIYYINHQLQVTVFYDAVTLLLLGYKEKNKNYEKPRRDDSYLKINYSIKSMLKLLGYPSKYMDVSDELKELKEFYEKAGDKKDHQLIKQVISSISRDRIEYLKKNIRDTQRFIYKVKYEYEDPSISEDRPTGSFNSTVDPNAFLDKYKDKFTNMRLKDKNNKNKVFKGWKAVKYGLYFKDLDNITVNISDDVKYLAAEDVSAYDYHGNVILYYIVREMNKLLKYNDNKTLGVTISFFVLDIIIRLFSLFNKEKLMTNFEIKRFTYIIQSRATIYDVEEAGHGITGDTEGFYEEHKNDDAEVDLEALDKREDAQEELDAIDMADVDMDDGSYFEIDYQPGVNID